MGPYCLLGEERGFAEKNTCPSVFGQQKCKRLRPRPLSHRPQGDPSSTTSRSRSPLFLQRTHRFLWPARDAGTGEPWLGQQVVTGMGSRATAAEGGFMGTVETGESGTAWLLLW